MRAILEIGAPSCGGVSLLYLKVNISRYVDAAFPGWVECSMMDAIGHEHRIVVKVPEVTAAHLDETSNFPQPGFIACIVIERNKRDDGRHIVRIDMQKPWCVETNVGRAKFDVFSEQVCELTREERRR
jgi:hypothetical protein